MRSAHPKDESKNGGEMQGVGGIMRVVDVMVPVENQDEAIAFYTGVLGFDLVADKPYGDGQRWVEVAPPRAAPRSRSCRHTATIPPAATRASRSGADDVRMAHAEMEEMGVDVDAEIMGGGEVPSFFWFRDRDANTLMIVTGA